MKPGCQEPLEGITYAAASKQFPPTKCHSPAKELDTVIFLTCRALQSSTAGLGTVVNSFWCLQSKTADFCRGDCSGVAHPLIVRTQQQLSERRALHAEHCTQSTAEEPLPILRTAAKSSAPPACRAGPFLVLSLSYSHERHIPQNTCNSSQAACRARWTISASPGMRLCSGRSAGSLRTPTGTTLASAAQL